MVDILKKIAEYKREEVVRAKKEIPLSELESLIREAPPTRGFHSALKNAREQNKIGLIAEIKKASPSKGIIRETFNPTELAKAYENAGATCLSVLTDTPSFQGHANFLKAARRATNLPILRKDFMIDTYQVAEARAWGADCILIIMAMVDDTLAQELFSAAHQWNLDVLIEIHNLEECERALKLKPHMIGINNRNLHDFSVDLSVTENLIPHIPKDILIVSESGFITKEDIQRITNKGVTTFLIGETLMRQDNVESATRDLLINL